MSERTYYQIPCAMTPPVEAILDRRIEELKAKYPKKKYERGISRARFLLASSMLLLAQDDKVILDMLDIASANMKLCRKKK